jgi:hypothetical protein
MRASLRVESIPHSIELIPDHIVGPTLRTVSIERNLPLKLAPLGILRFFCLVKSDKNVSHISMRSRINISKAGNAPTRTSLRISKRKRHGYQMWSPEAVIFDPRESSGLEYETMGFLCRAFSKLSRDL